MNIIHVAYTVYPLPPKGYGGVELGIYALALEQAKQGHKIFVFANSESVIPGCQIIPCGILGEKSDGKEQQGKVINLCRSVPIDIIHDHSPWGYIGRIDCNVPVLRTVYGDPEKRYIKTLRDDSIVSFTSHGFAEFYGFPDAPVIRSAVFYDISKIPFNSDIKKRDDWLVYVGQMSIHKGPHVAIKWAKEMKRNLLLLGPIKDKKFFKAQIRPNLTLQTNELSRAVGHVGKQERTIDHVYRQNLRIAYAGLVTKEQLWKVLLRARASLVPSMCAEAMSRVVLESMAVGCPVLAHPKGGIPESLGNDVGGRISMSISDIARFERTIEEWYDPHAARRHIEQNRTSKIMAEDCMNIYQKIVTGKLR